MRTVAHQALQTLQAGCLLCMLVKTEQKSIATISSVIMSLTYLGNVDAVLQDLIITALGWVIAALQHMAA